MFFRFRHTWSSNPAERCIKVYREINRGKYAPEIHIGNDMVDNAYVINELRPEFRRVLRKNERKCKFQACGTKPKNKFSGATKDKKQFSDFTITATGIYMWSI